MYLIVGLGNPGSQYALTRHNIGFMVIDALNDSYSGSSFKKDKKAEVSKVLINSKPCWLMKPQTYMNLSGETVQPFMNYYSIKKDHLLVIHDEIEIPFKAMRYQYKRGHGGHNGVRNIHQFLGGPDYTRLRLGVSRPSHSGQNPGDFVLQNFNQSEQEELPDFLNRAVDSVEVFIQDGWQKAANQFNSNPKDKA